MLGNAMYNEIFLMLGNDMYNGIFLFWIFRLFPSNVIIMYSQFSVHFLALSINFISWMTDTLIYTNKYYNYISSFDGIDLFFGGKRESTFSTLITLVLKEFWNKNEKVWWELLSKWQTTKKNQQQWNSLCLLKFSIQP